MRASNNEGARLAKLSSQYNWNKIAELIIDYTHPSDGVEHLRVIYTRLIDYILQDSDFIGGNEHLSNAIWYLQEVIEALDGMSESETNAEHKLALHVVSAE